MSALDLRVGDVVKARARRWPEGSYIEGAVYLPDEFSEPRVCGFLIAAITSNAWEVEVVSRAARPVYVNHDRTEHVPGDIVSYRSRYTGHVVGPFMFTEKEEWAGAHPGGQKTNWVGLPYGHRDTGPIFNADRLVLLVDGETKRAVTS